MTSYRVDAFDRINARLNAKAPHVTVMRFCEACGTDWDSRTWASCPVCASHAAKRDKLDTLLPTNPLTRGAERAGRV